MKTERRIAGAGAMTLAVLMWTSPIVAFALPDGGVAWWRAEGNAQDSIGENHGTLVGGTSFAIGVEGQCFLFDGTSGYMDLTHSGDLDFGTNNFSISVWAFFSSSGTGLSADQDILQKNLGVHPNHNGYLLEYVGTDPQPTLRFSVWDTDVNKNDLMIEAPLVVDRWFHIAAVRTGNQNRLFLDGSPLGEQTAGSNVDVGIGGVARIGAKVHGGVDRHFNGGIDEVSLYSRALTQPEIDSLATAPPGPPPDIVSSHGNGELTWINSQTNLFYRIEWAPALTTPSAWHSDFASLADIRSSSSVVTSSVPMFYRVCGSSNPSVYAAPVPKTGQTNVSQSGDDGSYGKGLAWPQPRFTVQADTNCVLDNLTGLIWARDANMGGPMNWSNAITYCEGLTYGGTNDWRLPNRRELLSLCDFSRYYPALCNTAGTGQWTEGDPFINVLSPVFYWLSTTYAGPTPGYAWNVSLGLGVPDRDLKTTTHYVWPVRKGVSQ